MRVKNDEKTIATIKDAQMTKYNTDGGLKKTIMFSYFFFFVRVETIVKSVLISDPTLVTFYFFPKSHAFPDSRFLPLKKLRHSMHQLSILKFEIK